MADRGGTFAFPGVVFAGTSSLTLVRVDDVEAFVTTAVEDIEVTKDLPFFFSLARVFLTKSQKRREAKRRSGRNRQRNPENLLTLLAIAGEEVAKKSFSRTE